MWAEFGLPKCAEGLLAGFQASSLKEGVWVLLLVLCTLVRRECAVQ